jgi:2-polyprenyl-3-methyl-5-hydroxy-6-metoxy-1,4-benzoquinol methylase
MYLQYDGLFQKLRLRYFAKVLRRYRIAPGSRMLDYGCGPGDMLAIARECGLDARGADASEYSVGLARQRGLDVTLGDVTALAPERGSFDVVFVQSVIEHVHDPVALLRSLRELLRPDGLLLVSSPTPGAQFWDDPTHVRPHTPRSFRSLAQLCELEVVEITYVFAFLLGLRLENAFFYRVLNVLPFPTGSNILGAFQRSAAPA